MKKKIIRTWREPTDEELMTVWSLCWIGIGVIRWYMGMT